MKLKSFIKMFALFVIGGLIYFVLEMLFRGRSHWTMVVVGGVCFLICGAINEIFDYDMSLLKQGMICAALVTGVELIAGIIINLWMGLNVWDYSNMPLNLFGQICLPFSLLWVGLGIVAVIVDDYLRYWLFGEEKPHYKLIP
ncbi:MAG: hypothetical protein E7253_07875 [Lachnospiraceae bacterium]|nr:hypothetical protein [Lachnospiraceae bacterium]